MEPMTTRLGDVDTPFQGLCSGTFRALTCDAESLVSVCTLVLQFIKDRAWINQRVIGKGKKGFNGWI